MQFLLLRHGETPWNVDGRWQGHAAVGLNANGHAQAQHTAAFIARQSAQGALHISAIYTSDSLRTRQTVAPIAALLNMSVTPDPRLREIDVGDWQGLTLEEVLAYDGERYHQVRAEGLRGVRPNGESWAMVHTRVDAAVREIVIRHPDLTDDHTILITSHGGTIRGALQAFGIDDTKIKFIDNCSLTSLRYQPAEQRFMLLDGNNTAHLADLSSSDAHAQPDAIKPMA